jgi:hypothetical protein
VGLLFRGLEAKVERSGGNDDMMQRHSILAGKCYRDRLGAIYRVVGFDGNGVQCVLYHRTDQGGFVEREHSQSWPDFLEDLQGEVECPLPQQ